MNKRLLKTRIMSLLLVLAIILPIFPLNVIGESIILNDDLVNFESDTISKEELDAWVDSKIEEIADVYLKNEDNDDWIMSELGKIDKDINQKSIDAQLNRLFSDKEDRKEPKEENANELLKIILALRASGIDVENVYGRNLVEELIINKEKRPFYYESCGLWAINSDDYNINQKYAEEIDKMVEDLLKYQKDSGYFKNFMEIDDTGFSLLALAPYYNGNVSYGSKFNKGGERYEELEKAVNKTLEAISKDQKEDGDITENNGNSNIMIVLGLSALNPEFIWSEEYTVNGNNFLKALKDKYNIENGFKWKSTDEKTNLMATEQGFRTLITYKSMQEGNGIVFDYRGKDKKGILIEEDTISKEELDAWVDNKIEEIADVYLKNEKNGDWIMSELGKIDKDINQKSIDAQLNRLFSDKEDRKEPKEQNANELLKIILALRASGIDVENVYGRNLVEELINIDMNSFYDYSCALWAINSDNYKCLEDQKNQDKVDVLIKKLIDNISDGYVTSGLSKYDDTGFALLSLSPYYHGIAKGKYNNSEAVKIVVEQILKHLEEFQLDNGDYNNGGPWGSENGNTFLSVLGGISSIDPDLIFSDGFKSLDGKNMLEILNDKYNIENGFKWKSTDAKTNLMATEQGFRTLITYKSMQEGNGIVFDYRGKDKKGISIDGNEIPNNDTDKPGKDPEDGNESPVSPVDPIEEYTITLSIDKNTINKGYVLEPTKVKFKSGENVWDVLKREMDSRNISYRVQDGSDNEYGSVYVQEIDGDGEFDHGSASGWMYNVNGWYPNYGASEYKLKDGDVVQWRYTTNLGEDLGEDLSKWENDSTSSGNSTIIPSTDKSKETNKDKESINTSKELKKVYKDYKEISAWSEDAILKATEKGIIKGFAGKFNPKGDITRAEFTKVILEILEEDSEVSIENTFNDIKTTDWYYRYVLKANELGLITGFEDKFNPDNTITREEMAVIIDRAIRLKGISNDSGLGTSFKDDTNISKWAKDSINKVSKLNIMTGYDGKIEPKSNATREMAVVVAMRTHDLLNK